MTGLTVSMQIHAHERLIKDAQCVESLKILLDRKRVDYYYGVETVFAVALSQGNSRASENLQKAVNFPDP